MVVAMGVGMVLLAPVWVAVFELAGIDGLLDRPDLLAVISATDMTVAMTVWMLYRGHGGRRTLEMAAAMYVPYLVLIVPYWLGMFPGEEIMMGGHTLMLPAMAIAMLARRTEYSQHHYSPYPVHSFVSVVARRWPTWVALAVTMDNWQHPSVPDPWVMLILPAAYLVIGGVRGRLRDPRMLALQLAGLALYLVLAVAAVNAGPVAATWIVAAGWGFHALWDFAHHRANAVVPRGYAEWCGVVDLVIAVTIVLFL
jgi:hypothetical protein